MDDGEATVLGLCRSKPPFSMGGSFSYSKQPHKRLPVSLATSPSDLGPFISLPSLSMTCPHQGSYKISPFPMKHQQTFWRVWLSPRWISGVSTSPFYTHLPHYHLPLSPSANTTHLRANLRSSKSPVTGSGHGNTGETSGEPPWRGKRALSHFCSGTSCCWWEEDALRAAGGAWYGFHRSVRFCSAFTDVGWKIIRTWVCDACSQIFFFFLSFTQKDGISALICWRNFLELSLNVQQTLFFFLHFHSLVKSWNQSTAWCTIVHLFFLVFYSLCFNPTLISKWKCKMFIY